MKMIRKICTMIIICILLFTFYNSCSYAYDWEGQINNSSSAKGDASVLNPITNLAGAAVTVTRVVCMGVAITMLVVLAMKYMSAAPGEKATIKKSAITYVVGAVIMFAVSGILGIIQNFSNVIK